MGFILKRGNVVGDTTSGCSTRVLFNFCWDDHSL